MIIDRDARERGHGLGLTAAGEDDQALGVEAADILRANDHAVGDAEVFEGVGDFDVVDHAAADESDFAADAGSDVDDLLNTVDGGREARQNDAARGGAAKFFDARDDVAFGAGEAGALDVGGVGEKREDAFVAVTGEGVEIKGGAADGSTDGERDAIDGAVGYRNEFDFEGADFDEAAAGDDLAEGGGLEEAGFIETLFYEREGEAGAVHGDIKVAEDVGERADVIFVAVSEHDGADMGAILFQIGDVGDDEVDAEEFGLGEHHAGVDDDDVVTKPQGHHVHAKFAEAAERDGGEGLRGFAQVGSVSTV